MTFTAIIQDANMKRKKQLTIGQKWYNYEEMGKKFNEEFKKEKRKK